ncbi:MAG: PHP domain-containing protein, partial [Clostridia bacterium]|nr:PHP domain-containing protein [Clostridia bacterium]
MKLFYDLHIHSALSPCGDEDMTPNNIVNMAYIKGLDIIAITDHNSAGNARAVMEAGKGVIKVVPGMEVTTSEEVHTLCLFPDIDSAEDMSKYVRSKMTGIKNQPEIFGRQLIMNSMDEIVGEEENLLVNAVDMDIYEVSAETKKRGGLFIPAHIDKTSY